MNEIATFQTIQSDMMPLESLMAHNAMIQQVMKATMKEGEHFGAIPGCGDKPVLLKAGAEKLAFTFRLCPQFDVTQTDLEGGHREYRVVCRMISAGGNFLGEGVGCGTTMEGKYRFRTENTGREVPKEYWTLRDPALLGGREYSTRKNDNRWFVYHKVEHDNPADYYNTVLKMAKKRAQVDATLTVLACSDIFTRDLEEGLPNLPVAPAVVAPPAKQVQQEEAPAPPQSNAAGEKLITLPQQKRLFAIARESKVSSEEVKAIVFALLGIEHTEQIPMSKYEEVVLQVQGFHNG